MPACMSSLHITHIYGHMVYILRDPLMHVLKAHVLKRMYNVHVTVVPNDRSHDQGRQQRFRNSPSRTIVQRRLVPRKSYRISSTSSSAINGGSFYSRVLVILKFQELPLSYLDANVTEKL